MKLHSIILSSIIALCAAHPGHHEEPNELGRLFKREYNAQVRRGMANCANHLEARGISARAEERRMKTFEDMRLKLHARDTDTALKKSHLSTQPISPQTPKNVLFNESSTCILNPEAETGPYWVPGEYIRNDLREQQPGVPIIIDAQFLDVETCEPLENVWWDLWSCNATGVYGGVVANGNGNTDDAANVNATFLRGIQKSGSDGWVQFTTIFPGHYTGRTTHHHIIARLNATVLPNNTITGGTVAHVGQFFWDQDLIYKVEATYPYNTNHIAMTTNAVDGDYHVETEGTDSDPVFNYKIFQDDLSDGLLGWITVVVNTSARYDPNYSFVLTPEGGVAESGGD